jgi:hypothetical protein
LIGLPFTALSCASRTVAGNVAEAVAGAGAEGFAGAGEAGLAGTVFALGAAALLAGSSLELQLEAPNSATSVSTVTVAATRSGVQKLSGLLSCFSEDIE